MCGQLFSRAIWYSCARNSIVAIGLALSSLLVDSAAAQTQPPQSLPVVIENDDARDGLYEAATDALAQIHFQENVPLAQLTVACGRRHNADGTADLWAEVARRRSWPSR